MAEYVLYNVGPFIGAAVEIDRETAERIRREAGFIPLHEYEKYIEPVEGEIGVFFGTRVYVKDGDNSG